ncbi:riboflavin kinase [Microbacterium aquimaris]|uniref:riboflavin kinase n=1 Tax=Microbacterium aquimaris TaxID=459816 RepID=A0ABU5N328_9MICO|nr:riboflavin kinase [Microbacterium aquimaris]MDZ8160499.1 riboflavin kinase [Microbacterium aquimaris]
MLGNGREEVSRRLAERDGDRFEGGNWRTGDLYGCTLDARLVAYLRAMEAFEHPDDLARQAADDVAASRRLLAGRTGR